MPLVTPQSRTAPPTLACTFLWITNIAPWNVLALLDLKILVLQLSCAVCILSDELVLPMIPCSLVASTLDDTVFFHS